MIRNDEFNTENRFNRENEPDYTNSFPRDHDPRDPYYDEDEDNMAPEEFIEVEEEEEFEDSALRATGPDGDPYDDDDDGLIERDGELDPDFGEEDEESDLYEEDEPLNEADQPTTETDAPQTLENPRGTSASRKEDRNPGRMIGHEPGTI